MIYLLSMGFSRCDINLIQGICDLIFITNSFLFYLYQPPKIRSVINNITAVPLENIDEPLKNFVWEFDKVPL